MSMPNEEISPLIDEWLSCGRSRPSRPVLRRRSQRPPLGRDRQAIADLRRIWLFAEELGGDDIISFNLYGLDDGRHARKSCEMSSEKVVAFVRGYVYA
jgi:hypothetical protein